MLPVVGIALITSLGFILEITEPSSLAEQKCGVYDTSASSGAGAAYAWCVPALEEIKKKKIPALSFGVYTWDNWARTLSNTYGIHSALFDCYADKNTFKNFGKTITLSYDWYSLCLGPELTNHNSRVFLDWQSTTKVLGLDNANQASLIVKFDIEGSEWEVLETMTDAQLNTILMFDLEIHFCLPKHSSTRGLPYKLRIQRQLLRLDQYFYVTRRFADFDYVLPECLTNPSAPKTGLTMMSLSYVNKMFINNG